jgi:hypothetical protein
MPSPAVAPIADASRAPAMIAFTTSFLVLAIISYAARMYCRVRLLRNVWWDDYIISVAMVSYQPNLG